MRDIESKALTGSKGAFRRVDRRIHLSEMPTCGFALASIGKFFALRPGRV